MTMVMMMMMVVVISGGDGFGIHGVDNDCNFKCLPILPIRSKEY